MSHAHSRSPLHKFLHWIEELAHVGFELLTELIVRPRSKHHRPKWVLFWVFAALATIIGIFAYAQGIKVSGIGALFSKAGELIYNVYPLWLPLLLGKIFADLWLAYVRLDFIKKNPGVVLEIRVPKEITKSPRAMELFFSAMFEKGSVTYVETYWEGKLRPWFSFEIASFGGELHFFAWTMLKYRNVFESQLYAQYPTVEIVEVSDYAKKKIYDPRRNFMWGTYFALTKPDIYPIMTYVDYGLDKETEEEYKIDPLSSLLEYLGSIKKGEEVWIQILIRAHSELKLVEGHLFKKKDWTESAMREVNKIMRRDPKTKSTRQKTETGFPIVPTLTEWEKNQVEAIERSINKRPFETMVRLCYLAEPERFSGMSATISGLLGTFRKPFNSNLLNGFKLGWYTDLKDGTKDLLWFVGLREWGIRKFQPHYAHTMLDAYRRRSIFYPPYKNWQSTPYILTAEELATIYHIPGQVISTPTFGRLMSKKVEPPPNLPV